MRVCFCLASSFKETNGTFSPASFLHLTIDPSTELSEIIAAWIAKVVLDRIGQQTNVEATCSESKETKFRQNVAPQKRNLKKTHNTFTKTKHDVTYIVPKILWYTMFACVLFPISVSSCTIHVDILKTKKHV